MARSSVNCLKTGSEGLVERNSGKSCALREAHAKATMAETARARGDLAPFGQGMARDHGERESAGSGGKGGREGEVARAERGQGEAGDEGSEPPCRARERGPTPFVHDATRLQEGRGGAGSGEQAAD